MFKQAKSLLLILKRTWKWAIFQDLCTASGPVHPYPILRHNIWTTAELLVTWCHGVYSSADEGFSPGWRVFEADMQNSDISNPWRCQGTPTQIGGIPLRPFKLSGNPWLCPHAWTALTRGVDPLACGSWSVATIAVFSWQMDDRRHHRG